MSFPKIMGVVNVTPDSFSDGGLYQSTEDAVSHALQLVEQGADILDIGGESTRPGAVAVPVDQEYGRVIPVIEGIRRVNTSIPISIDTSKAIVANDAIAAGASMINDVTAGQHDPHMFSVAAEHGVSLVLMHMQGEPRTMQESPSYMNVVGDVATFLKTRVQLAKEAGVQTVFVDPGIGFGKSLEHNLALLRSIDTIAEIAPVVLGISRKRFLGALTGIENAAERDVPTAFIHALMIYRNVHTIRVHNVAMLVQLRKLAEEVG